MGKTFVILAVLLAAFAGYVSVQPDDFRYTRSLTMNASPETVFAQVNDLQNWNAWSPWAKLDPNAKSTFEGPQAGQGAAMKWAGNSDVGVGTMTITESKPAELVRFKLDFKEPFETTHQADFTFKPTTTGGTEVSWSMYGQNNFIGKAMSVVMDCEKMVGEMFDNGLGNMKTIVETMPVAAPIPAPGEPMPAAVPLEAAPAVEAPVPAEATPAPAATPAP